jgi:single-strand DNA-binding protein
MSTIPICIVGTIATDPKFTKTDSKAAFCSFRLASNERRFDREKNTWIDGDTNWFTVNVFRRLAEHANTSFSKGDRVIVSGRLRIRRWEAKEKTGLSTEVDAEALGHDLRWGTSSFTKRTGGETPTSSGNESGTAPSGAPASTSRDELSQQSWVSPDSAEPSSPGEDGFTPSAVAA